jgi:hypothetical protein
MLKRSGPRIAADPRSYAAPTVEQPWPGGGSSQIHFYLGTLAHRHALLGYPIIVQGAYAADGLNPSCFWLSTSWF